MNILVVLKVNIFCAHQIGQIGPPPPNYVDLLNLERL